jgi:hypothetical protein
MKTQRAQIAKAVLRKNSDTGIFTIPISMYTTELL